MANQMRHATDDLTQSLLAHTKSFSFGQVMRLSRLLNVQNTALVVTNDSASTAMPQRHALSIKMSHIAHANDGHCHTLSQYHNFLPPHYLSNLLTAPKDTKVIWQDFYHLLQPTESKKHLDLLRQQYPIIDYEYAQNRGKTDQLQRSILGLTGHHHAQHTDNTAQHEFHLRYSGYFYFKIRNHTDLRTLLTTHLKYPISIRPMVGKWLTLDKTQHTCLGQNNHQLTNRTFLGQRTWHQQHGINICIGPLSYQAYQKLLPSTEDYQKLCTLIRCYLPQEHTFNIELQLDRTTLAPYRLKQPQRRRLSQDTFLNHHSKPTLTNTTLSKIFEYSKGDTQ